jgi:hypothetical protein
LHSLPLAHFSTVSGLHALGPQQCLGLHAWGACMLCRGLSFGSTRGSGLCIFGARHAVLLWPTFLKRTIFACNLPEPPLLLRLGSRVGGCCSECPHPGCTMRATSKLYQSRGTQHLLSTFTIYGLICFKGCCARLLYCARSITAVMTNTIRRETPNLPAGGHQHRTTIDINIADFTWSQLSTTWLISERNPAQPRRRRARCCRFSARQSTYLYANVTNGSRRHGRSYGCKRFPVT